MQDRIFGDRERALEDSYFRQVDAKLVEKLRQRAHLDEIALALGQKLQVDNLDLLQRVRETGLTRDTAAALFLAPLVQVAWADGSVTRKERDTVLRLARNRDLDEQSPAYAQLEAWLQDRPSDALFDTALEVLKYGLSVLPPKEQKERIESLVDACQEVASASGKGLATLLALGNTVSSDEDTMLDRIVKALRSHV